MPPTQLNGTRLGSSAPSEGVKLPPLTEQVEERLFGKVIPRQVNVADYPELAGILALLNKCRKKFATMHGDRDEEYVIVLSEGASAMIDKHGTIYMGVSFLRGCLQYVEVPIGALAHEIGHRPKKWFGERFQVHQPGLTRAEIEALCREEETRADIFAGKGLAELGYSCEPLIDYLKAVQTRPHPEYHPWEVRAEVIRDAHAGRAYSADHRRKLFPQYERNMSPRGHIGRG